MARFPADRAYPSQKRLVRGDLKDVLPAGLPKNAECPPCAFSGAAAVNGASPFQRRFSLYTKAAIPPVSCHRRGYSLDCFPSHRSAFNIVITNKGYYPGTNGGVVLQEAVDLKEGVSLTFTIDAMPSLSSDGADSWVSIGVFDQPNYMDVSHLDQAVDLVILIRPDTDAATVNVPSTISRRAAATPSKSRRRATNTQSSGRARR